MYLTDEQLFHCDSILSCDRLDWDDDNYDKNGKQITKAICKERDCHCLQQRYFDRIGVKSPYEVKYGKK